MRKRIPLTLAMWYPFTLLFMTEDRIKEMLKDIIDNGAEYEFRWLRTDGWSDWKPYKLGEEILCNDSRYEYRIKPTYIPYKDDKEFVRDYEIRYMKHLTGVEEIISHPMAVPVIWIKTKSDNADSLLVTKFCSNGVYVCGYHITFDELYSYYEYLDGTPCGIMEIQ